MTDTSESFLIPPEYYFQTTYEIPFDQGLVKAVKQNKRPENIPALPDLMFSDSQSPANVSVALAWNHSGIACFIEQENFHLKKYPKQIGVDGIHLQHHQIELFFDTRDMKSNKRMNRFCSKLMTTFPFQHGKELSFSRLFNFGADAPKDKNQSDEAQCQIVSSVEEGTCRIAFWVPKQFLTGYDPENVPSLGFFYVVKFCSEFDDQYYGLNEQFPYGSDPSLWHSLKLKTD